MNLHKILMLYDKRGYLAMNLLPGAGRRVDLGRMKASLEKTGCIVEVECLHNLKFPSSYKGWFVIYPSSEDPGLFYKDYIENILIQLQEEGAILLPRFELFRAHHNKAFMELQRKRMSAPFQTVISETIHFLNEIDDIRIQSYPVVIKTSEGSGSVGVSLAHNKKELKKKAKRMGEVVFRGTGYSQKRHIQHILGVWKRKILKEFVCETPFPRANLVIQTFIPGLDRDYKVLIFGEKYYLLQREVRKNDFRASGSGKLSFPEELGLIENLVLSFARQAYLELNTPMLSIDIAYDGKKCHMIEFQCLNFGPYTLQFSKCFFKYDCGVWTKIVSESILEEEMVNSWMHYLSKFNREEHDSESTFSQ